VRKDILLSRTNGIDAVLKANHLDAILTPVSVARTWRRAPVIRLSWSPSVWFRTAVSAAVPRRFQPKPSPFGVGFTGAACSEPKLFSIAYAFEQATKRRVPPASTP